MARAGGNNKILRCSFCGKDADHVRKLFAGDNGIYICDDCVNICANILEEEGVGRYDDDEIHLYTPVEIKNYLDDYELILLESKNYFSYFISFIPKFTITNDNVNEIKFIKKFYFQSFDNEAYHEINFINYGDYINCRIINIFFMDDSAEADPGC